VSGTLTLKSSLDTAVRILDYRLSRATSPAVSEIFKYRVALLCTKISKAYKKVSSVVSPVSVSPSRYSVLSVESMNCDSDCTLPSKGVCQDRFSSTILLEGPGMQGTNEEVSPDTSRC